jgi:SLT domain-containing protein
VGRLGHDVEHDFGDLRHRTAVIFDGMRGDIAHLWDVTWSNTVGRVQRGIADVVSWIAGLPHRTVQALSGWGNSLNSFAHNAMHLLWEGLKAGAGGILGWIQHFASGVVGIFKKVWGWFSPSAVMYQGGKSLMQGLQKGIQDHAHLAKSAAQAAAAGAAAGAGGGAISGNVASWINSALKITGMPSSWFPLLARLVGFESGGNALARNLTPAGIAAGYPEGIAQVTIGTFAGSHLPGYNNIWNPVDNLVAGIRHILGAWGTIFNIPGLGSPGPYGGYALGTAAAAPGWAWVGERGPELLRFRGGEQVVPGGAGGGDMSTVEALLGELCGLVAANNQLTARAPAATGAGLGAALGSAGRASTYRALYS